MPTVKVACCVPRQCWMQWQKLKWLEEAVSKTDCDLFLLSQEFFGGGSCREICKQKGIATDDAPVTEDWLIETIGLIASRHKKHIGVGATVNRNGVNTEDYLYFSSNGQLLGYHSKIALPVQDTIVRNGASKVTPETDFDRAVKVIELPKLGIRVGTVFCWQVYFNEFWTALEAQKCSLVVHPIKFAPRAWYKKGQNAAGENTRVGFTQERGSDNPESDALGWIRKLKFESEFKQLPIAVTCNSWSGGKQYLALVGFVDETCQQTELKHVPSTADAEEIVVHEYDPSLYDELEHLSLAVYARFKKVWQPLMQGTMRRKAVRIEQRALDGRAQEALDKYLAKQEECGPFESYCKEA